VTPAHDPNDYAVYTRHLGKPGEIGILNLMTPDGKVNDTDPSWAKYAGLTFAQARKRILEDLAAGGFHNPETDVKPHEANVKFSDRSKTAIQPYLSDQWFVKMAPLAEPALEVVRDGTIKFFPERHAQQYLSWLGEKRDWPISRQLWWGHRIPVWSAQAYKIHNPDTPHITQAIQDWQVEGRISLHVRSLRDEPAFDDQGNILDYNFICVRDPQKDQELVAFLEATGHVQDPDVLDTWFSSALWPHSTLGWPDATADLARWYPTSVLMTGRDIITLWVARMVMMGMYNMGTPNGDSSPPLAPRSAGVEPGQRPGLKEKGIPFAHVAINPTILDGKGERMSKSKGNGVDPVDIIDTHGADALRFTMTSMATETQDARMPVQVVCPHCGERFDNPEGKAQVVTCPKCKKKLTRPFENATGTEEAPLCKMTSKRFDEGRNFCTKLWNAARFVMSGSGMVASATMVGSNPNMVAEATMPQTLADRWIVSRFNRAVDESNTALATYRFDQYAKACYDFFWRDFCDWYLETAKPALKDPARSASTSQTLAAMLDGVLRLMHPMIPFITERLWWQLNLVRPERGTPPSEKLVLAKWPTAGAVDSAAEELFGKLQEIIAAIRNVRNEYNIKKAVTVSFSTGGDLAAQVRSNRELIETLAVCSINQIQENLAVPRNSARASAAGIDVFVEDVIDPDAEKIRISRQIDSLKQKITAMKARLANPSYADKAPAHLVQQTRDELAALEAELKKLEG
jgi:valyl-tRNA synthetase